MGPEGEGAYGGTGGVFRRILVGFDGSKEAQRALRIAVNLAADLHGEVKVLLVVRAPAHNETPEQRASAAKAEEENLTRGLAEVRSQTPGPWEVTPQVVVDDHPARAIAHHVERHGFDLIVVGGHGRERVTHGGIGHSLEELLRAHPCPVLVV